MEKLRSARLVAIGWSLAIVLAACGDDGDSGEVTGAGEATAETTVAGTAASSASPDPALEGTVTVLAAASLTDAFEEAGEAFAAANTGVRVELSFAGSSALREQILSGAPADVFASANHANMEQVVADGAASEPADLVENELQIVVPAGNPEQVEGLAAFADPDLLIGLCAEEVPCGQLGREALAKAGVTPSVDTNEPDVRSLLTKVEAGELDAGLVYRTDVLTAGDNVEGVEVPAEHNVIATYPIATLTDAGNPEGAAAFVEFLLSDDGQAIFASYGFGAP